MRTEEEKADHEAQHQARVAEIAEQERIAERGAKALAMLEPGHPHIDVILWLAQRISELEEDSARASGTGNAVNELQALERRRR